MFLRYELSFIVKHLAKSKTLNVAKRSVDAIVNGGGYINKLESLGLTDLPHNFKGDTKGSYFIVQFVAPTMTLPAVKTALKLDQDIVRSTVIKLKSKKAFECTLQDELKPPVYRPEVHQMIKEAEERVPVKEKFQQNTGLDYYPFPQ